MFGITRTVVFVAVVTIITLQVLRCEAMSIQDIETLLEKSCPLVCQDKIQSEFLKTQCKCLKDAKIFRFGKRSQLGDILRYYNNAD